MTTKGKRPMRAITPSDKIEAIQRVNEGESKASVARDIGVPESTLRGWCKNENKLRFMTSRMSSPDTDKSNDGEPVDKRARTESPAAQPRSPAAGLDLTAPPTQPAPVAPPAAISPKRTPAPPADTPVELTTKRAEPSPVQQPPRDRRSDPGASVSMSAISPLSGLAHNLTQSHLGLSFNEIANNLTLLAQLNPSISALSAQPASRALRSVRSPKPAHNGALNMSDKHRVKSHHHSDPYRPNGSKSSHHSMSSSATSSQAVDDQLWYWMKAHQMLDLSAQSTVAAAAAAVHPLQLPHTSEPSMPPKTVTPAASINPHLDYNRNNWLWQYYKQFGGAMALPDDKVKSGSQVPKDKTAENILYSQLIKGKIDERETTTNTSQSHFHPREEQREAKNGSRKAMESAASPGADAENKVPTPTRSPDTGRNHTKARIVLDNLLYNSNSQSVNKEIENATVTNGAWDAAAIEALEHGDKFLAWLDATSDPSVTHMHVNQLRELLHKLRSRRPPTAHTSHSSSARRK